MKRIPDSLTPEQAWKVLLSFPTLPVTVVPLEQTVGYCLTDNIDVPEDVPSVDRSFMDGYAVRSEDVASIPSTLRIVGEVAMGELPSRGIGRGETMAIPTGGFLPPGADAVVMQEDTELNGDTVMIKKSIQPGENVQKRGEDFQHGDLLFARHHRLRPQDLATLAIFGIRRLSVFRKPSVTVISTGSELMPSGSEKLEAGKIRETNSIALCAAAAHFGFDCRLAGIIPDDLELQRQTLGKALGESDVVLFSGGSSVGAKDFTLDAIHFFPDTKVHFHGLAIRPGNPTLFASIGTRWVFGLPGQPVSSLIVFYEFVLPLLLHLSGVRLRFETFHAEYFRRQSAVLSRDVSPLRQKTEYLRVKLQGEKAIPLLGKSASLSTLAYADGFVMIPPGESVLRAGSTVNVIIFP